MEKDANISQLTGRWRQDHSQNENYDEFLRENGLSWWIRKLVKLFKISPIEEYIVNGNQITYRQYTNQQRPSVDMTLTLGQPQNISMRGLGNFETVVSLDEYGRLVTRTKKASGEMVTTGRIDSQGQLELSILLPTGKTCRRVLKRVQ
ncbi:PREDICTED: fatty acid-binding protein homolog 4-like [Branchiostoma belcheri]|uniref:Fatty acid-binding protein homolog 4-like n=1 Tax=Branchiostoma belcheri TaxID=7741 RepID=A0A6P4ZAX1_BRABE|nr:PREDICTED: fatty acid-binding protein homolog 4-like [Branchiostoma belcheri]